eukprot:6460525-Amphidinium_carterae.1
MHERKLSIMLRKMKLMQNFNVISRKCAVCGVYCGKCGRCRNRNCSARSRRVTALHKEDSKYIISSHHNAADLQMQAVTTLCGVIGIGAAQSHMLTGMDHKMVERMYTTLRAEVANKVLQVQGGIDLNPTGRWVDCEADEVTLCKKSAGDGHVTWCQYLGVVRRGFPQTLILIKLRDRTTIRRAP